MIKIYCAARVFATFGVDIVSSASRSAMDGVIDLTIDENSLSSVRSEDIVTM